MAVCIEQPVAAQHDTAGSGECVSKYVEKEMIVELDR